MIRVIYATSAHGARGRTSFNPLVQGSTPWRPTCDFMGLDPQDHVSQLTDLRQWANTIRRHEYVGYQLRGCWANHPHAIWEPSTLAAEWHPHLQPQTTRPGPGARIPRPVATRNHAPNRRHHPGRLDENRSAGGAGGSTMDCDFAR